MLRLVALLRACGMRVLLWPLGLLSAAAIAAWGVLFVPAPVVDWMLKQDITDQAELWKRRVVLHLEDAESTFTTGTVTQDDVAYLVLLPEASDVYRFKLFSPDGTVFWSTRDTDVGTTNTKPYFQGMVARGEVYYKHEAKETSEIDDVELHSNATDQTQLHEVAEVYTPVMSNGRFLGAIEFYTDITDVRSRLIWRAQVALTVLSGLALLALLAVTIVIVRANRAQYDALRARTDHERKTLDKELQMAREVQLLGELNEWLQSSKSLEELFEMVSKFLTHLLPESAGSIYVYSNSRDVLDGASSWNGGVLKDRIRPDECWGLRRGRTYRYGSTEVEFTCEHAEPHDKQPYFCFPILAHGETVGLMHLKALEGVEEKAFLNSQKLAQHCAEQISMAIANVRMRDQLQDQSIRDPLTGLYNRRHMNETLRVALDRFRRADEQVSVISIDVDHFKKFNDNHGHDAGDMVLRAVGEVLIQSCKANDVACRPGGEEFALIMQDTSMDATQTRAEAVRKAVEAISVRYGEKTLPRITISAGVAIAPDHGTLPQDLLRAADDALYAAKGKGRNRVCVAGETDAPATPRIAAE